MSLLGPSGCGKSTVLRLIAGLRQASGGRIDWSGGDAPGEIGFVFQEPTLMPWATVFDNVWLPLRLRGQGRRGRGRRRLRARSRWSASAGSPGPIRASSRAG